MVYFSNLSEFGPRRDRDSRRLQEKLRADKKAEILDRMRRKQQQEEEQREKDEVEAQKRREARARRPAVDATRLHQTRSLVRI